MRTTLTLDDDVAALLERVVAQRRTSLKAVVNDALREGLRQMIAPAKRSAPYRTTAVSMGRCLVGSLDDIEEVLTIAEGESHK
jgi:hypothetical protein